MTKPKLHPAKRGRKPKAPGEKLQQVTVRLSPSHRLGLDLIARAHGLSLNEALDRVVAKALNSELVGQDPVTDLITQLGGWELQKPSDPVLREKVAEEILKSPADLILRLPPELRRPHERLFVELYEHSIQSTVGIEALRANPQAALKILDACGAAQRRGDSIESLQSSWTHLLDVTDD